jgi:hypothetical protein
VFIVERLQNLACACFLAQRCSFILKNPNFDAIFISILAIFAFFSFFLAKRSKFRNGNESNPAWGLVENRPASAENPQHCG